MLWNEVYTIMDAQKKKTKKEDAQISNLKFHLYRKYCYFLCLEKRTFEYSSFRA